MIPLPVPDEIIDRSGAAPRIELLPAGARPRQLAVRTLLLGLLLVLADLRSPAHLTRVHQPSSPSPKPQARRAGGLEARPAPTGRPSAPSAWSPARWPGTSPTA